MRFPVGVGPCSGRVGHQAAFQGKKSWTVDPKSYSSCMSSPQVPSPPCWKAWSCHHRKGPMGNVAAFCGKWKAERQRAGRFYEILNTGETSLTTLLEEQWSARDGNMGSLCWEFKKMDFSGGLQSFWAKQHLFSGSRAVKLAALVLL